MGFLSLDNKDPLAAIDDAGSSDGVCWNILFLCSILFNLI
jgi:hypothetical protein